MTQMTEDEYRVNHLLTRLGTQTARHERELAELALGKAVAEQRAADLAAMVEELRAQLGPQNDEVPAGSPGP